VTAPVGVPGGEVLGYTPPAPPRDGGHVDEERAVLEVRESRRGGRGLFATQDIGEDALLMSAPVLLIPPEQREALEETIVDAYVYEWDDDGTTGLVLGVSSMCNHATDPNAYLWLVPETTSAELWSLRPIRTGEEVTVSYRASGDPDAPLWFEVVEDEVDAAR
jgi:uncharacterized protein